MCIIMAYVKMVNSLVRGGSRKYQERAEGGASGDLPAII